MTPRDTFPSRVAATRRPRHMERACLKASSSYPPYLHLSNPMLPFHILLVNGYALIFIHFNIFQHSSVYKEKSSAWTSTWTPDQSAHEWGHLLATEGHCVEHKIFFSTRNSICTEFGFFRSFVMRRKCTHGGRCAQCSGAHRGRSESVV